MKRLLALTVAVLLLAPMVALAVPPDTPYFRGGDAVGQVTGTGMRQQDLVNLLKALRNRVWGITAAGGAVLAVGTTASTVRTTSIINYTINGKTYGKASTDDFCALTPHAANVLGLTTAAYFRFEIDAAGDCGVLMGPIGAVASGTLNGAIVMPRRSANKATLGVLLVGGQVFTPGTTTTAASATVVYTNGDPDLIDMLEP